MKWIEEVFKVSDVKSCTQLLGCNADITPLIIADIYMKWQEEIPAMNGIIIFLGDVDFIEEAPQFIGNHKLTYIYQPRSFFEKVTPESDIGESWIMWDLLNSRIVHNAK